MAKRTQQARRPAVPPMEWNHALSIEKRDDGSYLLWDGNRLAHVPPWAARLMKGAAYEELARRVFSSFTQMPEHEQQRLLRKWVLG